MPNQCQFSMNIKGKPEDIREFTKLFIFQEEVGKGDKEHYFARTFLENYENHKDFLNEHKEDIDKGEVFIEGWCAWSCWSCWFEGYPKGECVTLEWAMKEYNIEVDCDSEEEGAGFEENITTEEGIPIYSSKEMPTYECQNCGSKCAFPSSYSQGELEWEECGECGAVGEWFDNLKEILETKIKNG